MTLHNPFIIAPNLEPGLRIGDHHYITMRFDDRTSRDGRAIYVYTIMRDGHDDVVGDDLKSGVGGGTLQKGFSDLLSCLSSFAGARRYGNEDSDNWDLFPEELAEWAVQHDDDFGFLQIDLEENRSLITE